MFAQRREYRTVAKAGHNVYDLSDPFITTRSTSQGLPLTNSKRSRHRDGLGRLEDPKMPYHEDGYFLNPKDARLTPLRIQDSSNLRNPTPWAIRLVYGIFRSVIRQEDDRPYTRMERIRAWTLVVLKLLPGSPALVTLMLWPRNYSGNVHPEGRYDRIPYRDWSCAAPTRNDNNGEVNQKRSVSTLEPRYPLAGHHGLPPSAYSSSVQVGIEPSFSREFLSHESGPRYLCFVGNDTVAGGIPYRRMKVAEWMRETDTNSEPDFVFVSYTRLQFCITTPDETLHERPSDDAYTQRHNMNVSDCEYLVNLGCLAARNAGVHAFWIDFECLLPTENSNETLDNMSDVFRICDIVRLCQAMVIVRGPPIDARDQPATVRNRAAWLTQWGSRLWTVPEALLCPVSSIDIYTAGDPVPETMLKRRLAAAAWEDAAQMGDLIHHYEGSLRLTSLELVSTALQGLMRRGTDMRMPGDVSYCLMGLLRRRPAIEVSDGPFKAFARLSLSNDSNQLLERLICFQPLRPDSPWYEIQDAWDANLWDIEPFCQVAGLIDDATVTLDGAFGATIQWDALSQIGFVKRATAWRSTLEFVVRALPFIFLIDFLLILFVPLVLVKANQTGRFIDIYSAVVGSMVLMIPLILVVPFLVIHLYRGKFWSVQAHFFGMRGIPDLHEVEKCIFGTSMQRLRWSATGSRLSRHYEEHGECVSLPPIQDEREVAEAKLSGLEIFTLIDTYTMTATSFYARKAPSVVMVCGREGGMQRAILCSYDWTTQTFCRETVLRMRTIVLERMSRVDRFRFGLNSTGTPR